MASPPADPGAPRDWLPFDRRYLPLATLAALIGLASLLVRDFFSQMIWLPLLDLLINLYVFYLRVPQNVVWVVFMTLGVLAVLRALLPAPAENEELVPLPPPPGRLDHWAPLVAEAADGDHARWLLAHELADLTVALVERQRGDSAESIRRQIADGRLHLPPPLQALFDVERTLPGYRDFLEARKAAGRRSPAPLQALDFDAAVQVLEQWRDSAAGVA